MWPDAEQTQQLLAGAQAGRREAINGLLERHRASLRRMIELRLDRGLARRVDASDIVQDVLLEAHGRLPDFFNQGKMPFFLWLRHLARDRIIEMHRHHRGAQRRSLDREQGMDDPALDRQLLRDFLVDPELTPAAAATRRELEERFLQAVEQLDDDDRDLILMRHFEQLGNSEVAQALGISPAAAGMRHLRALRKLRVMLGEDADGTDDPAAAGT